MGTQSTVYGRITVNKDFDKVKTYFEQMPIDDSFLYISPEMFKVGTTTGRLFYEELIITFGATYKAVEDFWTEYVLKFERILEDIEFVSVVMHLETEFMGTYSFFWLSKASGYSVDNSDRMIEMPKWFFGVGSRNMWGHLIELEGNKHDYPFGFSYPVQIALVSQKTN
ncbi:hypothetical protein [Spirosoma fluminis]